MSRSARPVTVLSIIRDCLDALLHPSARYDALTRARHRAFMAPRLLGSLAAFAAFPVYLAMRGAPSAIEVAAFAWLIAPILLSWFLSRTGRYEGAHVLSSLALSGLIMAVAVTTGGIESFAAIWLVVVPLEAALSASRRVAAFASLLALSCAGILILSEEQAHWQQRLNDHASTAVMVRPVTLKGLHRKLSELLDGSEDQNL